MRLCEELNLCRFCERTGCNKKVAVPPKVDLVYFKYKDSDGTDIEFKGNRHDLEKLLDDKDNK